MQPPVMQIEALDALCGQGLALHQSGQLDGARRFYEVVLACDPGHGQALHLLGVVCLQTGQTEQGAELIGRAADARPDDGAVHGNLSNALNALGRHEQALSAADRAVALQPNDAAAHGNRGRALRALGRRDEAAGAYSRAADLNPGQSKAHYNLGVTLREAGRLADALVSLDRALAIDPTHAQAQHTRGVVLRELGRLEAAVASLDQAAALAPGQPETWFDRSVALRAMRRLEDALDSCDYALALRPDYAEAWGIRGNLLSDLERPEEALQAYDRAVTLKPDLAEAWSNRMIALRDLRRPEEALASCDRALAIDPGYAEGHNNRGGALYEFQRLDEAVLAFDAALALKPDYAEAYANRAVVRMQQRRFADAMADFDRAVALKPDHAEGQYGQAMCRLAMGEEAEGWRQYEWRWATRQFAEAVRGFTRPLWLGAEDLRGQSILVHAEQGLGDTLQFCRYLRPVLDRGAAVVFEVQKGLERLMARTAGSTVIVTRGAPLPDCDFQVPLMSLPLALGARAHDYAEPYLTADPDAAAAWAARLEPGSLKVGICWAGGARPDQPIAHAIDLRRSLPLSAFRPLADIPGVQLYSLQKGPPAGELQAWDGPPILDFTDEWSDFADTADFVANLDLVIACDTSTAHLAGGLGKPVWVLNRFDACWRWLHQRECSPWYPTARLFNQCEPGDWAGVMERVRGALGVLAGA